jgi:DNA-binding beta-propeller fold protein YncE
MHDLPQQVIRVLVRGTAVLALAISLGACPTGKATKDSKPLVWPDPPQEARFHFEQTIRTSTDVVEETRAERLKRMATGQGQAGKAFNKPWGVAAYDHRIFITDTVGRKIHVFDMAAKTYEEWGTSGPGTVAKPLGVVVDGQGLIYVVDGAGRRVVVYNQKGDFINSIGSGKDLDKPAGIAVTKDGSRIYVVDSGGVDSDKHHIVAFDGRTGEKLMVIGARGGEPGQFNLPVGITIGRDGTIFVVDGGNFRVEAFSPDGKFLRAFGEIGRRTGQFARPKDIATDREGNLYVTDSSFGNFQIFDDKGQLLLFVGEQSQEGGPAQYMLPSGIAIDPTDGRVYVVDQFFKKVDIYRPEGTAANRPARKVALDKDGKPIKDGESRK